MKTRNLVVYAVAAATLGISSVSFAQGPGPGQRYEAPRAQRVDDRRDDRRDFREDRRDDRRDFRQERRDDRRDFRHSRNDRPHYYYNARGPEFRRGGYIPYEYRNRQYVVVNHSQHHLHAPPRGHQWVQVGGDYVLIAIATGLIASVLSGVY